MLSASLKGQQKAVVKTNPFFSDTKENNGYGFEYFGNKAKNAVAYRERFVSLSSSSNSDRSKGSSTVGLQGLCGQPSEEEEEEAESPPQPRRMYHELAGNKGNLDEKGSEESDDEDDGKIYYPNYGEPFMLTRTYDILPPICRCPITPFIPSPVESPIQHGTMEAGAGDIPVSVCEQVYRNNNNSVPHLLVMCIGLYNQVEERPLADFEEDVFYKEYLEKSSVPKVPLLKAEMQRRAREAGIGKLRKNSVLKPEAIAWLKNNPVKGKDNIKFLIKQEQALYMAMKAVAAETLAAEKEKLSSAAWTGPKPWLRLYLCATEDKALEAMKFKDSVMDKDELDARRSTDRPETFEEVVARLYNDASLHLETEPLPTLHTTFSETIELPFDSMPGGKITSETVKMRMSESRAKLLQVSYYSPLASYVSFATR
jgi:hypothetical protein